MHLDSDGDQVTVRIEPVPEGEEGGFRYTGYMERVSRWLELNGEQTRNAIRTSVAGGTRYIDQALAALVAEGFASRRDGPRGSHLYASTKPYREGEE